MAGVGYLPLGVSGCGGSFCRDTTERADGVDYSHPEAVVSVGIADDPECASCTSIEETYEHVCPYIHVFEDEAEYESWAAERDAATTPLPVETGVALAGGLAESLFGPTS